MLCSGCSTVQLNSVRVMQVKTIDIECNKLTKYVRVVVQVSRITQHCSLRHDTIEQRSFIFIKPDKVLDSVSGLEIQSVELETDKAENVPVCHDALC